MSEEQLKKCLNCPLYKSGKCKPIEGINKFREV